jgi:hypothetical protein
MMSRLMVLVTVVLAMTAMLVASVTPALAALRPPVAGIMGGGGTPVDPMVCTVVAEDSPLIGWRNGACWVFHPTL